ncbi:MAG: hypothetical protein IJ781_13195 [Atopobiaceae bacterium]|nr:hypothetical protein [Atopobiaceae bacterium]
MGLTAKRPDEFVIRGTAAAIERMGKVSKARLYKADANGFLLGEVRLADGVVVRRIRAETGPHDRLQQNVDESAATAIGALGDSARARLRDLMMDALAR